MANINIASYLEGQSYTAPYNDDTGAQDGTVSLGLIPAHSTGLTLELATEVLGNSTRAYGAFFLSSGTGNRLPYADGDTITIRGQTFTFRTSPGGSDLVLPSVGEQEAAQSLADAINSSAQLSPLYVAQAILVPNSIWMTTVRAINPGAEYRLQSGVTVEVEAADPFITIPFIELAQPVAANRGERLSAYDYRIFADIYAVTLEYGRKPNDDFFSLSPADVARVTRLELSYQPHNRYQFDAGPYLRPFTEVPFPALPSALTGNFQVVADPQAFFIEYGEAFRGGYDPVFDLPVDPATAIEDNRLRYITVGRTETAWAVAGALRANIPGEQQDAPGSPASPYALWRYYWDQDEQVITLPYLGLHGLLDKRASAQVYRRTVQRSKAPAFRYFLYRNDRTSGKFYRVRLRISYTLNDGTTGSLFASATQLQKGGVLGVNASPQAVGLFALEESTGKKVLEYDVEAQVNTNGTEGGTYITLAVLDRCELAPGWAAAPLDYDSRIYTVYWRNSLGAFDSFDYPQSKESQFDINPVEYERTTLPDQAADTARHERTTFAGRGEIEITLRSGWVGPAEHAWLKDCLRAPQHWLYEPRGLLRAVQLIDGDWEEDVNDNQFRHSITLRMSRMEQEVKA